MIERLLDGERQLGGEAYHSSIAQILEATDTLINRLDDVEIELIYTGEFSALFPGLESGQYDIVIIRHCRSDGCVRRAAYVAFRDNVP